MVVGEVGEMLSLDDVGPVPTSSGGHSYILTMADNFSRYAEAFPVRIQDAKTIARVLVDNWISRYGCPLQILTDQGRCFESELFQELCTLPGVAKLRTSPLKPSSNGLLERMHKTMNGLIARVIAQDHRNCHLVLTSVMCLPGATVNSSTNFTPNRLFLGRELCQHVDIIIGDCIDRPTPTTSYCE